MPKYIPYPDGDTARTRSAELWQAARGPGWQAGNVTTRLYGVRTRTGDPEADADLPDGVDAALVVSARDRYLDTLLREDRLTQAEMLRLVGLYPEWSAAGTYRAGDLVAYQSQVWRCVQPHDAQADRTPDAVPALWAATVPEGVIPEWVQPTSAHDAYNTGDCVTYNGAIYESTIDGNVWSPDAYPPSWRLIA